MMKFLNYIFVKPKPKVMSEKEELRLRLFANSNALDKRQLILILTQYNIKNMIKQIRKDTGDVYWEMWDDDGRIATIRKVDRIYVGEFEHYKLKHRTKKNVIAHIKLILKLRRDMINKNEHAAQGVHNTNLAY